MTILPIEFLITGENFDTWTKVDSLAFKELMNMFMTLDYMFEPFRTILKEKYG